MMGKRKPDNGNTVQEPGIILIVDDLPENLELLSTILVREGYTTVPAPNGELALMSVDKQVPDLVLLDIKMPGMDGYEVCSALKENPRTKDVPVVFISGLDETSNMVKAFDVGGVDYITKPFVRGEVLARIRTHLRLHKLQTDLERQVELRTFELSRTNARLSAEILERKRVAESLRKSEERYRFFITNSLEGIYRKVVEPPMPLSLSADEQVDWLLSNTRVAECNKIYAKMYGFDSSEEMIGTKLAEKWGENVDLGIGIVRDWIRSYYQFPDYEAMEHTREGMYKWYLKSSVGIIEDGCLTGFWGTQIDITLRKHAEENIRRVKEEWEQTFNSITDMIAIVDTDCRIVRVNSAMAKRLGMVPDEAIGLKCAEYLHGGSSAFPVCPFPDFKKDETQKTVEIHDAGRERELMVTVTPIFDNKRELMGAVHIAQDVTERKRAEEEQKKLEVQLQHTQKLEAIGSLAGGIAHDFNNIIGALTGFTELALDYLDMGDDVEVRENLGEVLKAGKRSRDLVKQILAFSRHGEQQRAPLQVSLVLKEVLTLLRAILPSTIRITQNIAAKDAYVLGDATQVHQVIMNLCTNAFHAMGPKGGRLTIGLEKVSVGEADLRALPELSPGSFLRLTTGDTGHGISGETMSHIFDPFFTTKPKGEGAGLGLTVVHGIVKSHRGAIRVESRQGEGTVIQVYFPVLEAAEAMPGEERHQLAGGSETILLVDDDMAMVRSSKMRLEMLGYRVVATTSAPEAVERFLGNAGGFDLVLTDMTMPEMTGADLAHRIREERPDIPIILCTGFSELITSERLKNLGISEVLMKPFDKKQLANAVREALVQAALL